MAYMPAEEDDEYDSEDGFLDYGDSEQAHDPRIRADKNTATMMRGNIEQGQGDGKKAPAKYDYDPWSPSANYKRYQTVSTPGRSSHQSARANDFNVLGAEDIKMAVMKRNKDLLEKCLKQGVTVDEATRSGWTALMYAANCAFPDIVKLLLEKGADPNYQCDMYTVLMCACSGSTENTEAVGECVQLLVEAGAEVNAKDRFHTTPLMIASKEGHVSAVRELVKHGAEVNKQDSQGWTALTKATQRSQKAVVIELLDSGADPNIQHLDKLTVKDLAVNLPTDEMLALLERRPTTTNGDLPGSAQEASKVAATESSTGETYGKFTDLRYGELEVFLHGLNLPHLVGLFQQQLIDLNLLLTLTEQDLINAGVDQVGARKKILDAVNAVHKKDWQPSSLISLHFNKQISCADAVAMLANSSKHLRYIGSTVVYVREQMRKHPESITQPTDRVTPQQCMRHVEDTMKNVVALREQLQSLQVELSKEMRKRNLEPSDLVDSHRYKTRRKLSLPVFFGCMVVLCSCSAAVWYKKDVFLSYVPDKILQYFTVPS